MSTSSSATFEPLNGFIDRVQLQCLNEAEGHKAKDFFQSQEDDKVLKSDTDEQLLLIIPFNLSVKIHSLIIEGPNSNAPSHIKLFINRKSFDFSDAETLPSVQEINLSPNQTKKGSFVQIPLRFVKFQNCESLIIFVDKNHGGEETTIISKLVIMGQEIKVEGTRMDPESAPKFTRVNASEFT